MKAFFLTVQILSLGQTATGPTLEWVEIDGPPWGPPASHRPFSPPPGGVDNAFVSTSFCAALTWPTLPLDVVALGASAEDLQLAAAAAEWWNTSAAAPLFVFTGTASSSLVAIGMPINGDPNIHGRVQLGHFDCVISVAFLYLPDSAFPHAFARAVHLLGDVLALAHDEYAYSIADPRWSTNPYVLSRFAELTALDAERLLEMVTY